MIIINVVLLGCFNISKLDFGDWIGSYFREVIGEYVEILYYGGGRRIMTRI